MDYLSREDQALVDLLSLELSKAPEPGFAAITRSRLRRSAKAVILWPANRASVKLDRASRLLSEFGSLPLDRVRAVERGGQRQGHSSSSDRDHRVLAPLGWNEAGDGPGTEVDISPALIARTSAARSSTGITGSSPGFFDRKIAEVIHDRLPFLDLPDSAILASRCRHWS